MHEKSVSKIKPRKEKEKYFRSGEMNADDSIVFALSRERNEKSNPIENRMLLTILLNSWLSHLGLGA